MARRTTSVANTIAKSVEDTKLNPKVVDLYVSEGLLFQALNESLYGIVRKDETSEFNIAFMNGDYMDFTVEEDEAGAKQGVITRFSDEYVRKSEVPDEYRCRVLIDAIIPIKGAPPVEVKKAMEKSVATTSTPKQKQQPPKTGDVLDSMSDEELEALLAARKSNNQNKPSEEDVGDDNAADSEDEPETAEESDLSDNGTDSDDDVTSNSEADSDDESIYDESDDDSDDDRAVISKSIRQKQGKGNNNRFAQW